MRWAGLGSWTMQSPEPAAAAAPAAAPVRRVCIVTQAIYPDILGGAPIGAHRLANALAADGVEVDVHTVLYRRPPEARVEVDVQYRLERHPYPRMPWDGLGTAGNPFAWRMARAVQASPAPVAHLRSHLFFTSVFGARGARRSGKAIVVSVHGVRAQRSSIVNLLQEIWMQTFARRLFRQAHRVVCLTTRDRDEVLRYGARPEQTVVLWNAPDERLFHPDADPTAGGGGTGTTEADPPEVVWLGRHVEEKGLAYLVDAWADVVRRAPRANLVLVGDGPLRAEREQQVRRLGLQDSVRFAPFEDQARVAARLRRCAVFVLPSLREGFPISLVEAMACGKPVVTTEGLDEIVGPGGVTVPPADAGRLADALAGYLQDPGRRTRDGAAAAQRVAARYGMAALARAYLEVYEEAVRTREQRPKGGAASQEGP